jgi:hypothetical protein
MSQPRSKSHKAPDEQVHNSRPPDKAKFIALRTFSACVHRRKAASERAFAFIQQCHAMLFPFNVDHDMACASTISLSPSFRIFKLV